MQKANEEIPTYLVFTLAVAVFMACFGLADIETIRPLVNSSGFTAVYSFACFSAAWSWYGSRAVLAPRLIRSMGRVIGKGMNTAMPIILILASAALMLHRAANP